MNNPHTQTEALLVDTDSRPITLSECYALIDLQRQLLAAQERTIGLLEQTVTLLKKEVNNG